jgi:signal transduction histidine kinase
MEVTDNGRGITEEDIPHIFERFYKGAGDGLGLGLAIVKELVAVHGGTVEVRSGINKGATFSLYFPLGI